MAHLVPNSVITIGSFSVSGVHNVRIKKSMRSLINTAVIELPSVTKIIKRGVSQPKTVTTGEQFNDGDAVHINLGYSGDENVEFRGFVRRRNLNVPLSVECEGYSYLMRNDVNQSGHYKNTTAKKLLQLATAGTGIKIVCPVDFPISGIGLPDVNGIEICEYIKEASDHTLSIFFIDDDTLWCGLAYTAYASKSTAGVFGSPTVSYRRGWNCVKDAGIKQRTPKERVQVVYSGQLATGERIETQSRDKAAKNKLKNLLNHVPDANTMKAFAQEKEYNMNYTGFEGVIPAFLQPYAQPAFNAVVTDALYPELNGTYIIEGIEVVCGVGGGRRYVELGPQVGFGG